VSGDGPSCHKGIPASADEEKKLPRVHRALRVLTRFNRTLVRAREESEFLRATCEILVEAGGYRVAWVGFAEQDERKTVRPVAQAGYEKGYLETLHITWADTERGRGPTGTAIRAGKPVIARHIPTDPRFAPWRAEATKRGYASSIALPLIAEGQTLGALNIYAAEPDAFDAEEVRLLSELADDLACGTVSLRARAERQGAEEALGARSRQLATLNELTRTLARELDPVRVGQEILKAVQRLLPGTAGRLWERIESTEVLQAVAAVGLREARGGLTLKLRPGEGLLGIAAATRQAVTSRDVTQDPRFINRAWAMAEGLVSCIIVPLTFGDRVTGALAIYTRVPHEFSDEEVSLLQAFAAHAAITMENARLYESERRRTMELQAVMDLSRDIVGERPLQTLFREVVRRAVTLIRAHSGTLYLWDEQEQVLRPHAWLNLGDFMRQARYRLGQGITGAAAEAGRGLIWNEYAADPRHDHQVLQHVLLLACMAAPLKSRDRLIGVLTLNHTEAGCQFSAEDLRLLETFARQTAVAIENSRLYEERRLAAIQLEATVEDRTQELRVANTRLQEAMRQIEEASRHKSEFLDNMSHELRTPLNSVIGFSELLLGEGVGPLTEKQARYLGHIHNGGKHLLQLISDVLDLAKVEAGKFVLQPETLPVGATLEDILVIGRALAKKKAQTVEAEIEADLPALRGDPVRFKQILFNLLSNAVKFTPDNGRIGLAASRSAADRTLLEIRVTDTGVGIKAEDLPRLFQEFVQLETTQAQKHEGTGLGLALTKRLVEMHGGRIRAESEGEGKGSTFTVLLPFGGPQAPPAL